MTGETDVLAAQCSAERTLGSADRMETLATVTAIGLTITPLLARFGQLLARRIDGQAPIDDSDLDQERPGTIIIGFGRVGRAVARR